MQPLTLRLQIDHEGDRFIADVIDLPGVMVYGSTEAEAVRNAEALALEVIADRLKNAEDPLTGHPQSAALSLTSLHFTRQDGKLAIV